MKSRHNSPCPQGLARTQLRCPWCGATRPADLAPLCAACAGTLTAEVSGACPVPREARSMWDYAAALPCGNIRVSLGEGGTPLLPLARLYPDDQIFVKADWMNPTGSFKDRGASLAVSVALELGAEGIICASTGNNGAAVSAYAARAGLACIVVLPTTTPAGKIAQAQAAGATVLAVPGTFSDAYTFAERLAGLSGWANLTSTYINPYMTAAHASILYEVWGQLGGTVGSIIAPVGAGPMLDGIMAGARHLHCRGDMATMPVPIGVQAEGCAPIARAFALGHAQVEPWNEACTTIAGSIGDPLHGYPADGTRTLRLIREAGGQVVAVTDKAIMQAMEALACKEGVLAEPAALSTLAGLRQIDAASPGLLPRPVVLVLSGHALKDPGALRVDASEYIQVDSGTKPQDLIEKARHNHAANAAEQGTQASG